MRGSRGRDVGIIAGRMMGSDNRVAVITVWQGHGGVGERTWARVAGGDAPQREVRGVSVNKTRNFGGQRGEFVCYDRAGQCEQGELWNRL